MFGRKAGIRIKELEGLVGHLKAAQKREIRLRRDEISRTCLNYLIKEGMVVEEPYLFIDNHGKIVGYTPQLVSLLGITEDLQGKDYTRLFSGEGAPSVASLRSYFSGSEAKELRVPLKVRGKSREFLIEKRAPHIVETDLSYFGLREGGFRGKEHAHVVAFVPIRVSEPWLAGIRYRKVPKLGGTKENSSGELKDIYGGLIAKGWRTPQIEAYEQRLVLDGLRTLLEKLSKESKGS